MLPWNQTVWQQLTLDPERSAHALLFTGGHGLGKRDLAEKLANYVLCDGHLPHEQLFNAGSHPDFYVIRPEALIEETNNTPDALKLLSPPLTNAYAQRLVTPHSGKPKQVIGIDQIRLLKPLLTTHPHISKHRVVLIDAAEKMHVSAANALLKSLEEPPSNTLFILISNRPDLLPATVRSRCSMVHFTAPAFEDGARWLRATSQLNEEDIQAYLSMANNQPLLATYYAYYKYREFSRELLQSVNALWSNSMGIGEAAKQWHALGAEKSIELLHKLCTDLIQFKVNSEQNAYFFPVQQQWLIKVSQRLQKVALFNLYDDLMEAKRLILTTVDPLLVLESIGIKWADLPEH